MDPNDVKEVKESLEKAVKDFTRTGLRYSYIVIAALVLIGVVVNFFLPRGWVVWPVVLAVGIMTMIHEAAERNNEGVPPFQAYSWFAGALAVWMCVAVALSKVGAILFIVGIPALLIYCVRTFITYRKQRKLTTERREKGLCVACGEPLDPRMGTYCVMCGHSDEEGDLHRRIREMSQDRSQEEVATTRAALKPESPAAAARRKEQELLERRQRRSSMQKQQSDLRSQMEAGDEPKPKRYEL